MSLIQKNVFDNGISAVTEEMPDVESSCVGIWVSAGSRNEPRDVNGISHFIEHLLFKGTARRSALDISREIESVGGVLNAFTSREMTCFYAKVLNKDLPLAIDLLSDIFLHSKFDRAEMEKERLVVLQEIKMVEDTPDDLIHDLFAERFWKGQAIGRSVLGTTANIKSITRDGVLDYFTRHYRGKGVFISAAGGFKTKGVVKLLKGAFGRLRLRPSLVSSDAPAPSAGARLFKKSLEQVHLCMGVPAPPQSHEDRFKVYLLNTMLGSGMSSRLFQEIREKRGLAYSVYSYLSLCRDAGSLIAYAGTSKESFPEVVSLMFKEFARMGKGVGKTELANAKEQLKGGMLLGLETSDSRMTKLARDEFYFGRHVPVKEVVRGINKVTLKDIAETARGLLAPERVTLVAMGRVSKNGLPKRLSVIG